MDSLNRNIKFTLIRCAKEKLKEDRRFIIERKNDTTCLNKTKSRKVYLKESLMNFDDDTLIFENIDLENDYLDVAMAIGNDKSGKFFKPTNVFRFKNLNLNEESKEVWNLSYGSFMKVVYKFDGITCEPDKEKEIDNIVSKRRASKSLNSSFNNNCNNTVSISVSSPKKFDKDKIEFFDPRKNKDTVIVKSEIEKMNKRMNTSAFIVNTDKNENIFDKSEIFNQSLVSETKDVSRIKNLVGFFETANQKRNSRDNLSGLIIKEKDQKSVAKPSILENSNHGKLADCSSHDNPSIYTELSKFSAEEKQMEKEFNISKKRDKTVIDQEKFSIEDISQKRSSKKYDPNFSKTVSNMIDKKEMIVELDSNKSGSKLIILNPIECEIPEKEKHIAESFCDGFFIAGLKPTNALVIENSDDYISPCGHKDCSMLPAYKPEILQRYPVKDSNRLELTNLTATLCFPSGIKLCYAVDESEIRTDRNYQTTIVNQDGLKYYLMTYHYFIKLDNSTFHNTYDINPLKEFMKFEEIAQNFKNNPELKEKYEIKLEKQLEVCTSFNFNDYIYLPSCACLISKFPFTKQMELVLQTIIETAIDQNKTEADVYKLILHLVREIPIPINDKKLNFFVPGSFSKIEITNSIFLDLPVWTSNIKILLQLFSVENIITILNLMLMEQKLLFIDTEYSELSEVIDCFVSLLYPLVWEHTYIPILSSEMIKYLESFMPFVMGMHECLFQNAKPFLEQYEDIYIVYIKKNFIDVTANKKGKKLKKKELMTAPELPLEIEEEISKELKNLKTLMDPKENSGIANDDINFRVRNVFIISFVTMLEDYQNYQVLIDGIAYFNTEGFLKKRPEKYAKFYSELFETLLFRQFLQADLKEAFPYFFKQLKLNKDNNSIYSRTSLKRSNSIKSKLSSTTIISKRSSDSQYLNNNILTDSASLTNISFSDKNLDKKEIFLVYPYFLKEKVDANIFLDNSDENYKRIFGTSTYSLDIKPNNARIFSNIKNLNFEEVPKFYNRYLIPELKEKELSVCQIVKRNSYLNVNLSSAVKLITSMYEEKLKKLNFAKKETYNQYAQKRRQTFLKTSSCNDENIRSALDQEKIKEFVNDYMILLFTSKKLNEDQFKNLVIIFENRDGRKFLCDSLYLAKFKDKNFKLHYLGDESYDSMFLILDSGLRYLGEIYTFNNDEIIESAILLTKSSFHYYRDKINGEPLTILESMKNKSESYLIWSKLEFWTFWVKKEISEKSANRKIEDGFYFEIFVDVTNIMFSLGLKYEFIENTIVDNISNKYFKEKKVINAFSEYVKNCQSNKIK